MPIIMTKIHFEIRNVCTNLTQGAKVVCPPVGRLVSLVGVGT